MNFNSRMGNTTYPDRLADIPEALMSALRKLDKTGDYQELASSIRTVTCGGR